MIWYSSTASDNPCTVSGDGPAERDLLSTPEGLGTIFEQGDSESQPDLHYAFFVEVGIGGVKGIYTYSINIKFLTNGIVTWRLARYNSSCVRQNDFSDFSPEANVAGQYGSDFNDWQPTWAAGDLLVLEIWMKVNNMAKGDADITMNVGTLITSIDDNVSVGGIVIPQIEHSYKQRR